MSSSSDKHNDNFIAGFEPFININSTVLILGSFPSVLSRKNGFYYGNSRNRFWTTLANIYEEKTPQTIEEKKRFLTKHNIALWDIVTKADFKGSSDKVLEKSSFQFADIEKLLKKYPNIKKIFCNGRLAYKLFKSRYENSNLTAEYLPSTSPANTRFAPKTWESNLKG